MINVITRVETMLFMFLSKDSQPLSLLWVLKQGSIRKRRKMGVVRRCRQLLAVKYFSIDAWGLVLALFKGTRFSEEPSAVHDGENSRSAAASSSAPLSF